MYLLPLYFKGKSRPHASCSFNLRKRHSESTSICFHGIDGALWGWYCAISCWFEPARHRTNRTSTSFRWRSYILGVFVLLFYFILFIPYLFSMDTAWLYYHHYFSSGMFSKLSILRWGTSLTIIDCEGSADILDKIIQILRGFGHLIACLGSLQSWGYLKLNFLCSF